jgi:hypothetical protein
MGQSRIHLRADRYAIVEVDHVLVHHPDAARRDVVPDRRGLVGKARSRGRGLWRRAGYPGRRPMAGQVGARSNICGGSVQSGHSALRLASRLRRFRSAAPDSSGENPHCRTVRRADQVESQTELLRRTPVGCKRPPVAVRSCPGRGGAGSGPWRLPGLLRPAQARAVLAALEVGKHLRRRELPPHYH